MRTLSLLLVLLSGSMAFASGSFDESDHLTFVDLDGTLHVNCPSQFVTITCTKEVAEPITEAYFRESAPVDADQVVFKATRADHSVKTKKEAYLATDKRTADRVNLIRYGLFENPLLDEGVNHIDYVLSKKGTSVLTGAFEVTVRLDRRGCRPGDYFANSNDDCRNPGIHCEDYFFRESNCQY